MGNTSSAPFVVRAARVAVLRTLKFFRHLNLRIRSGSRSLRYRVRETTWGRTLWQVASFARAPGERRRRRSLANQIYAPTSLTMDASRGYRLLPANHLPELAAALRTCQQLFERKVGASPQDEKRKEKRAFLRNLLNNDDLRAHPELVDFALSDWALAIATDYLRMVPYLNRVDLLYSVARSTEDRIASQLFHVDPEGVTQVKFFINVFDTDEESGPFTFIPADETARALSAIRALRRRQGKPHDGRYTDEEIDAVGASSAIISVKGGPGSGVAVDTSRCLHLGSRVRPGAFRLCLYLQYCASLERGNAFDLDRYRHDPFRFMAVKESVRSVGGEVSAPHQMS